MTSIEQSTGFLVVRTARSMKKALDARLSKYGITSSQHTVLSALAKSNELPLSGIGKRVYLDKPAITGLADRLEKDGLVERRRDSKDRRVIKLHLTSKGRKLLQQMDKIATNVDNELVSTFSSDELKMFRGMLDRIWLYANGKDPGEV